MDLARPQAILLLLLVPAMIAMTLWSRSRRRAAWLALGQPGRPKIERAGAWIGALVLLIVALAGPRWGRVAGAEPPSGHDVILLIDVSRSMAAEDALPNRLGAVAIAAEGLIDALAREPGERVGVVAFAGRGVLKCPLTENLGAVVDAIRALRPDSVRPGGTNLGDGLLVALDAFDDREPSDGRTVVVFTDGEDHAGSWRGLIDRIRSARVIVHGVTVGDDEAGHTIPAASGPAAEVLRFRGQPVRSRRSDAALKEIRSASGGVLVPMGRLRADLAGLYRDHVAPSARRTRSYLRPPERHDRYEVFASAALGLLIVASWPSPRRLAVAAGLLSVASLGAGAPGATVASAIAEGEAAYRSRDFPRALAAFRKAVELDPRAVIPRYDVAATLFQLARFDESRAQYLLAAEAAEPGLRAKIDFALGNVAVAQRRIPEALAHYDACLATKVDGPGIAALKGDAEANRSFAVKLLPPPSTPDSEGDRRTSGPRARRPSGEDDAKPSDSDRSGEAGKGSGAGSPAGKASAAGSSAGAGGGGADPSASSAERRLDAMLDDVRKAQSSRLDEPAPPAGPATDLKEW